MRHSYPECPTPNISTIRGPAWYKILLRLNTHSSAPWTKKFWPQHVASIWITTRSIGDPISIRHTKTKQNLCCEFTSTKTSSAKKLFWIIYGKCDHSHAITLRNEHFLEKNMLLPFTHWENRIVLLTTDWVQKLNESPNENKAVITWLCRYYIFLESFCYYV